MLQQKPSRVHRQERHRFDLTKAAIFGCDANWGRVLCAMGYSGEQFDPEAVDVAFASCAGRILVCDHGKGLDFDEDLAKKILTEKEVIIEIDLRAGDATPPAGAAT